MKKIILLVVCGLLVGNVAFSQMKLGYINSAELLNIMPDVKKANADIEAYQKSFVDQLQQLQKEGNDKVQAYQAAEKTMTDAVKEARQQEIMDIENRLQTLQKSAEEKIVKKREELYGPILEKVQKAIEDVAKEKGYDYVFERGTGQGVLFAKESYNIMADVKTKLGVK
ncbi:MAG: OmpH family outer membrane protein [Flavipsychrobacter sp.]|nr:OmpH family outer membrane protein [Flavipsychrobacter sp.]